MSSKNGRLQVTSVSKMFGDVDLNCLFGWLAGR